MTKYSLSSKRPNVVGTTLPLRGVKLRGQRIVKRPNPGTYVNKKGILPNTMKVKKIKKIPVVSL